MRRPCTPSMFCTIAPVAKLDARPAPWCTVASSARRSRGTAPARVITCPLVSVSADQPSMIWAVVDTSAWAASARPTAPMRRRCARLVRNRFACSALACACETAFTTAEKGIAQGISNSGRPAWWAAVSSDPGTVSCCGPRPKPSATTEVSRSRCT
ncbi:hypothetical protein MAJHIDBO_00827 [Propionibacterium freudenreichii subsp. shermanii]|nr:hypothetical protein MAJHIDBO_00827 [Propionibacterium freudenreichii subsp. shermanii]SPS08630.1 hypothetical protein MAJHIDBO_00827 [Propionibacterium freudenreichii subsp. shermanii]